MKRARTISILTAVFGLMALPQIKAAEPTAYDLVKEGNRYIGEQSKDKVVEIRSEKSVGTLTPNIWYIVYYDPDATLKATEVKFGAGKKLKVSRPLRVLEPITGDNKTLDRSKLKVDSDKAIKVATSEELLKSLTLKSTQLWLQRDDEGPVWKVRVWAAKLKKPNEDVNVGDIFVSAETGKAIRTDLHIDRVD